MEDAELLARRLEDLGVEVQRLEGGGRIWQALHACSHGAGCSEASELRSALQEEPGVAAAVFASSAGWQPSPGALVRVSPAAGRSKASALAGHLATLRQPSSRTGTFRRFAVVGSTFSVPEQLANQWFELSEVRLFDAHGTNVAPQAEEISWLLEPAGNKDPRSLVSGVLWPEEKFSYWNSEEGHAHNGAALVQFTFQEPMRIVRAEFFSTNTESFGTNPSLCVWQGESWEPLLSCDAAGGLSVYYVADNSPAVSWPADGNSQRVTLALRGAEVSTYLSARQLVHGFQGWTPLHAAAALGNDAHVRALLENCPAAAATADPDGMLPIVLALLNLASLEVVSALWRAAPRESCACITSSPSLLWHLVTDTRLPALLNSPDVVRHSAEALELQSRAHAILDAARLFELLSAWTGLGGCEAGQRLSRSQIISAVAKGGASTAFHQPANWRAEVGMMVRPSPAQNKSLTRPGQVFKVAEILESGFCKLQRVGKTVVDSRLFETSGLVHCFDTWLPLHGAVALVQGIPEGVVVVEAILAAHPTAAATADANGVLPLSVALSNEAPDDVVLALALAAPSATGADGRTALHILAAAPTYSKNAYRPRSEEILRKTFKHYPEAAATIDRSGRLPAELLGVSVRSGEVATSFETIALLLPPAPDSKGFAAIVKRLLFVADYFGRTSGRDCNRPADVAGFFSSLVKTGIDVERLLLAAADLCLLEAAKVLITEHGAQGTSASPGDGRCAREVGIRSPDPEVSRLFKRLGAFLQRYEINSGPPVHRSKTCEVRWAVDVESGQLVALKLMRNQQQFARELASRFGGNRDLSLCVIVIIAWHAPAEQVYFPETGQQRAPATCGVSAVEPASALLSFHEYPYVLVMVRGTASLWHAMGSERICKHDPTTALSLFGQIVRKVGQLHSAGLVHGDIKPRNVLVDSSSLAVTLCDLDAAVPIGEIRGRDLKCSSAYCPPEHMQAHIASRDAGAPDTLRAHQSFDVWSLGVVLFELLAGRHLFSQDISDDSMVNSADVTKLCLWLVASDDLLDSVLPDAACGEDDGEASTLRNDACHLVRWCLQGDSRLRPTVTEILTHRLLGGDGAQAPAASLEPASDRGFELVEPEEQQASHRMGIVPQASHRMRYHMFISHMQSEASGDVGTLYYMLGALGVSCWRDQNTDEITEQAMRQGVYDSDIFVLFLTNSVLSRYFCLKEITWALEFKKPIFMIVETEDRFWSWDYTRWTRNECLRAICEKTGVGIWRPAPLQYDFDKITSQFPAVVELVTKHHDEQRLMPFRRRDFELNGLVRELVRRAAHSEQISWGRHLPPPPAEVNAGLSKPRSIYITAAVPPAQELVAQMTQSLAAVAPGVKMVQSLSEASHVLVLLTDGVILDQKTCPEQQLLGAVELRLTTVFAYSIDHGWDFAQFYKRDESKAKAAIASHEALVFRPSDSLAYEHHAMLLEILKRMPVRPGGRQQRD